MIFLASLISAPPIAMAGGIQPTWILGMDVQTNRDPNNGQPVVVSMATVQGTGDSFSLFNTTNARAGAGFNVEALVDYQGNPGPVVLYVTSANWNGSLGDPDPLLLFVSSYPASPQPPQLDSPPTGSTGYTIEIPPGDYSSSYYPITLSGPDTGGGVAFLLSTADTSDDGAGFISFVTTVPEPSSVLMLGTAIAVLALLRPLLSCRATPLPPPPPLFVHPTSCSSDRLLNPCMQSSPVR